MADSTAISALYAARPTLKVAGQVRAALSDALVSLSVEEDTAGLCRCEMSFANWGPRSGGVDYVFFDRQLLDFGARLQVTLGSGDAEAQVFDGRITAIEGRFPRERGPEIGILAEDAFQNLRMTRRTRSFEELTDADLFQRIAQEHSLQTSIDLTGPRHKVLAQVNQSDLAFLRSRARAIDAETWLEGTTLHAQQRSRRNAGEVTLRYRERLFELAVSADLAHQRTSYGVSGWDVASKQQILGEAGASILGAEVQDQDTGSSVLETAFAQRKERVVHLVPLSGDEARGLAESHYRMAARRFVSGEGLAEGDGRIRVGGRLRLEGLGPLFDGRYVVVRARHEFDQLAGLRTLFSVERPGLGKP